MKYETKKSFQRCTNGSKNNDDTNSANKWLDKYGCGLWMMNFWKHSYKYFFPVLRWISEFQLFTLFRKKFVPYQEMFWYYIIQQFPFCTWKSISRLEEDRLKSCSVEMDRTNFKVATLFNFWPNEANLEFHFDDWILFSFSSSICSRKEVWNICCLTPELWYITMKSNFKE